MDRLRPASTALVVKRVGHCATCSRPHQDECHVLAGDLRGTGPRSRRHDTDHGRKMSVRNCRSPSRAVKSCVGRRVFDAVKEPPGGVPRMKAAGVGRPTADTAAPARFLDWRSGRLPMRPRRLLRRGVFVSSGLQARYGGCQRRRGGRRVRVERAPGQILPGVACPWFREEAVSCVGAAFEPTTGKTKGGWEGLVCGWLSVAVSRMRCCSRHVPA